MKVKNKIIGRMILLLYMHGSVSRRVLFYQLFHFNIFILSQVKLEFEVRPSKTLLCDRIWVLSLLKCLR